MRKTTLLITLLAVAMFLLAACSPAGNANNVMTNNDTMMNNSDEMSDNDAMHNNDMDENMSDSSDDEMMNDAHDDDMMDDEKDNMSDDAHDNMSEDMKDEEGEMMDDETSSSPDWFDHEFINAATGETFTINGLKGKVVLVETMAMWCSNCLQQQKNVKELHSQLGERDDFVSIGLDIDSNEDAAMLAAYVEHNGFDWLYAVPPADITAEISRTFGPQFLNPPSTPIALIDKEGNLHTLPFGIKSVDDLMNYLDLYL